MPFRLHMSKVKSNVVRSSQRDRVKRCKPSICSVYLSHRCLPFTSNLSL